MDGCLYTVNVLTANEATTITLTIQARVTTCDSPCNLINVPKVNIYYRAESVIGT